MFIKPKLVVTQQEKINSMLKRCEELRKEGENGNDGSMKASKWMDQFIDAAQEQNSTILEVYQNHADVKYGKQIIETEDVGFFHTHILNVEHHLDYERLDFKDWNLEEFKDKKNIVASYPDMFNKRLPFSYGVCDSIEQFKNYEFEDYVSYEDDDDYSTTGFKLYDLLNDSEDGFAVFFYKIEKEPGEGGWRWHKWGPYIGKHDVQHEYLADEDLSDIGQEFVYVFHLYQFRD